MTALTVKSIKYQNPETSLIAEIGCPEEQFDDWIKRIKDTGCVVLETYTSSYTFGKWEKRKDT